MIAAGRVIVPDEVPAEVQLAAAEEINQTDPPSPWEHGRAKRYLATRLEDRNDPIYVQNLKPEAVYNLDPGLFHPYEKTNFKSNYRSLRKNIEGTRTAIDFDAEAFRQEQQAFPRPELTERGHRFWDRSEAQRLLREELGDECLSSKELES